MLLSISLAHLGDNLAKMNRTMAHVRPNYSRVSLCLKGYQTWFDTPVHWHTTTVVVFQALFTE